MLSWHFVVRRLVDFEENSINAALLGNDEDLKQTVKMGTHILFRVGSALWRRMRKTGRSLFQLRLVDASSRLENQESQRHRHRPAN